MYVLDSSVLIELINGRSLADKIEALLQNEPLVTTSISVHELLAGALSEKHQFILEGIFSTLRILPHDLFAARQSASIEKDLTKAGTKINDADIFIAGICKLHRAELVTLDKDFLRIKDLSVRLIKP